MPSPLTVVISQPMFFPWIGIFEQIRLCDIYVHYDDVQLSRGSFINRVRIHTDQGNKWMTLPIKWDKEIINQVEIQDFWQCRKKHLHSLYFNYKKAPFFNDMYALAEEIYQREYLLLSDFNQYAIEQISQYFGLRPQYFKSSELNISGKSSERVLAIVQHFKGSRYVTGHGALNYLNHDLFEQAGIAVDYMDYRRQSYPQLGNPFDPHLSILDLIACMGKEGINIIASDTKSWKEMMNE